MWLNDQRFTFLHTTQTHTHTFNILQQFMGIFTRSGFFYVERVQFHLDFLCLCGSKSDRVIYTATNSKRFVTIIIKKLVVVLMFD